MIYLRVAHTEDDDCDLFRFPNLDEAISYIKDEKIETYILLDFNDQAYPDNDYTWIVNYEIIPEGYTPEERKENMINLWEQLNLANPEKYPSKEEFIERWTAKEK